MVDLLKQAFVVAEITNSIRAWRSVRGNVPNYGHLAGAQKGVVPAPNEPVRATIILALISNAFTLTEYAHGLPVGIGGVHLPARAIRGPVVHTQVCALQPHVVPRVRTAKSNLR